MMNFKTILYEKRGPEARITLNRPEALNPISLEVLKEIDQALDDLESDASIKVLVVTGKGRAFSAGADLAFLDEVFGGQEGIKVFREFLMVWERVFNRLENLGVPVVAAVNGFALAGGLELVLVCDLVLAAKEARLGDQHANFGLVAGGGGTQRLPRKIGVNRAKELLITGDWFTPKEAQQMGLVNQVVPADKLEEAVREMVGRIASKSASASRTAKLLVNQGMQTDLYSALKLEHRAVELHMRGEDAREGIEAFKEKRKPVFK